MNSKVLVAKQLCSFFSAEKSVLILFHQIGVARHAHQHFDVVLLLNLLIQLLNNLVKIALHLRILSQELLRVEWLGHVLICPLARLVGQFLELVLLQARLHVKIILDFLSEELVLLKQLLGVLARLESLDLNDRNFVKQAQNSQYVFPSVVNVHFLESVERGTDQLR